MADQTLIDRMYSGDKNAIISGIMSERPILVMNAVMAGTKLGVRDTRFLIGLKKAGENDEVLLGIHLRKVAIAAEHLLGIKKYNGDDRTILLMIESEFGI